MDNKLVVATRPYFTRLDGLRDRIEDILGEDGGLTIRELCEKTASYRVPSTRHMTAVLMKDPKKRFRCENKAWYTC
jgi:hypothetical protein